jgi:hypothetical protein
MGRFKTPIFFFSLITVLFALSYIQPYDDTDDVVNGVRSNMTLRVDHGTGCQYLSNGPFGGLTPRLNRAGHHVGCE